MLAVVALAIVVTMSGVVTWQCLAGRKLITQQEHQYQADLLARAGLELAADRLLSDPKGYRGETAEVLPGGQVRIEVHKEAGQGLYRVTSVARFPGSDLHPLERSSTRLFRRTSRDNQVFLEVVSEP
jgi:hypothetical protein